MATGYNSGIYQIYNKQTQKCYIGSSCTLRKRFNAHKVALYKNAHYNKHLQAAYNKYGKDAFEWNIILYCAKKDLIFYEQRCIDAYTENELYNQTTIVVHPAMHYVKTTKFKQEAKNRMTALNNDPAFQQANKIRSKEHMIKQNKNPEFRKKAEEASKKAKQKPEVKEADTLRLLNWVANNKEQALANFEENKKNYRDNPDNLAAMKERGKLQAEKLNLEPGRKEKQRDRMLLLNLDPEYQKKCKAGRDKKEELKKLALKESK